MEIGVEAAIGLMSIVRLVKRVLIQTLVSLRITSLELPVRHLAMWLRRAGPERIPQTLVALPNRFISP
jgi:hypothetical protein